MRRPRWAPLAIAGVVTAEVLAFVTVGQMLGFGPTVLLVMAASLLGAALLRREGLRAWRGFREAAAAGAPPGPRVSDGVVGLAGALLLALPGLVTGLAGALLLLPPGRHLARSQVQARAERTMTSAQAGHVFGPRFVRVRQQPPHRPADGAPTAAGDTDDTEVVEGELVDDDPPAGHPHDRHRGGDRR